MPDTRLEEFCSDNQMNKDFCLKSPIIQARLSNIEVVKSTGHSPFKSRSAGPELVELIETEHFVEVMSALDDEGFVEAENNVPGVGEAIQEDPILSIRSNSLRGGVTAQGSMGTARSRSIGGTARSGSLGGTARSGSPIRDGTARNGSPIRDGMGSGSPVRNGTARRSVQAMSRPRTPDDVVLTGDVKADAEQLAHFSPAELQDYIEGDVQVATVVKSPAYTEARRSLSARGSMRRSGGVEGYPARSFPLAGED